MFELHILKHFYLTFASSFTFNKNARSGKFMSVFHHSFVAQLLSIHCFCESIFRHMWQELDFATESFLNNIFEKSKPVPCISTLFLPRVAGCGLCHGDGKTGLERDWGGIGAGRAAWRCRHSAAFRVIIHTLPQHNFFVIARKT
jgi:hypothetical protein